jgi:hypothetical protein
MEHEAKHTDQPTLQKETEEKSDVRFYRTIPPKHERDLDGYWTNGFIDRITEEECKDLVCIGKRHNSLIYVPRAIRECLDQVEFDRQMSTGLHFQRPSDDIRINHSKYMYRYLKRKYNIK